MQTDITNNVKVTPLSSTMAFKKHRKTLYIPIDIARITVNALVDSGSLASVHDKKKSKNKTLCLAKIRAEALPPQCYIQEADKKIGKSLANAHLMPVNSQNLPMPANLKEDILVELVFLDSRDITTFLPSSKYASPMFAQRKPSRKLRLLVDLRKK